MAEQNGQGSQGGFLGGPQMGEGFKLPAATVEQPQPVMQSPEAVAAQNGQDAAVEAMRAMKGVDVSLPTNEQLPTVTLNPSTEAAPAAATAPSEAAVTPTVEITAPDSTPPAESEQK